MPHHSVYPSIDIPSVDLWTFLFERDQRPFPDTKPIFIDAHTTASYSTAQIKDAASTLGKSIKATWHLSKGDVIAIISPNHIDVPVVLWGTVWAGCTATAINPGYTIDELVFQLVSSSTKAIFTQEELLPVVLVAASRKGIPLDRIVLLGEVKGVSTVQHFRSLTPKHDVSRTICDPTQDVAFLMYSSGTTGGPKAVQLTHTNVISSVLMANFGDQDNLSWQEDRVLTILPFFHVFGLVILLHSLAWRGIETYVMPRFELHTFCQYVQAYKITFSHIAPPIVLSLSKNPSVLNFDLSSFKMVSCGAAPLATDLIDTFYKKHGIPLKQSYGLTETTASVCSQLWHEWQTHSGSVGRLLPNHSCKIVSDAGLELPTNCYGELWLKGPSVFTGYLHNSEANTHAFSSDGYFKTGDVAHISPDGSIHIVGRLKELIKYNGFQVPPSELESLLLSHPWVDDAGVIGIHQKDLATELPRAFVKLKPGIIATEVTSKEIANWVATRVAYYKRLRGGVMLVSMIPKSPQGKILRVRLRELMV